MNYGWTDKFDPNLDATSDLDRLPDELSTPVDAFFDFEAWDGACLTANSAIETVGAGINDDWTSAQHHGELHGSHRFGEYPPLLDTSWIGSGLSPFADSLITDVPMFDHTSLMDPSGVAPCANALSGVVSLESHVDQNDIFPMHTITSEQSHAPPKLTSSTPTHHHELYPVADHGVTPQSPPVVVANKKRARISKAAKKILNDHFSINPYPSEFETSALAGTTQLQGRTIKTWFSNTRSRLKTADLPVGESQLIDADRRKQGGKSRAQTVSRRSLEALEKVSPAASMTSLQRYLAMPASEEAVPVEVIDSVTGCSDREINQQTPNDISMHLLAFREKVSRLPPQGASYTRPTRSIAGSESSGGSAQSRGSQRSFRSVDSRGSRRGRKLWMRSEQQASASSSIIPKSRDRQGISAAILSGERQSASLEAQERTTSRIYCTWPGCETSFNFPFEWCRHEEAKHYQPYVYVCCLGTTLGSMVDSCFVCTGTFFSVGHVAEVHMKSCMDKTREDRSFFRKDQLVQHIRGVHRVGKRSERLMQQLVSKWKTVNPQISSISLKCGFCGNQFNTWEDRQTHVLEHLQAGICKASWWPARLPIATEAFLKPLDGTLTCTSCGFVCDNDFLISKGQHQCKVWSCRFLHDHHALYSTWTSNADETTLTASCKLCNFSEMSENQSSIEAHAHFHQYRSCGQERFMSEREFAAHLICFHGAIRGSEFEMSLQIWTHQRWLRGDVSGAHAVSTRGFCESILCDRKVT